MAQPLTAEAFAPFGRVLDGSDARSAFVNEGRARRRDLARFSGTQGRFVLARYDVCGSTLPLEVGVLEGHPHSDQSFMALSGGPALVVVAGTAPGGVPDLARARAFIAGSECPFLYGAGTWHAPLHALAGGGAFLMGVHESGTPADCETAALTTTLRVEDGSWDAGIG